MAKTYAGAKGQFVDNKMKEGMTNKQAHSAWKNSDQKKEFDQQKGSNDAEDTRQNTSNIDRSYESPWQDWADTADDF